MLARPIVLPVCAIAIALSIAATRGDSRFHTARSAAAITPAPAAMTPAEALARLKVLVGTWDSRETERGSRGQFTYRLTGGNNVLVEDAGGMMSTYHLDGGKLMVTHYCGAGNQPRMRARMLDERRMSFEMFDITNLKSPQAYHTTSVEVVFLSDDRVDVTFGGITDGQSSSQTFQLTRRKA